MVKSFDVGPRLWHSWQSGRFRHQTGLGSNPVIGHLFIQYMVLGFEPTTLKHESPPITTGPGLPPSILTLFEFKICLQCKIKPIKIEMCGYATPNLRR